jgi:O-antigen biosynthesis protein
LLKSRYDAIRDYIRSLRSALEDKRDGASPDLLVLTNGLERCITQLEEEDNELLRRLKKIEYSQRALDLHIAAIENSLIFRICRQTSVVLLAWKAKAGQILLHSPFHGLYLKLRPPAAINLHSHNKRNIAEQTAKTPAAVLRHTPKISIIMPVHHPRRDWLEKAVQSVIRQNYPHWELCACDDASDPWVREYFATKCHENIRICFDYSPDHLGISGTLNRAVSLASGDYFGFIDQDDTVSSDALQEVAETIQDEPADLIYSDEDVTDEYGRSMRPVLKPDWSPDLLLSGMYFGHLLVVSREAFARAGMFRKEFDGSQDFDLALRMSDEARAIKHIPRILYHWRMHQGSTALHSSAKPYTHAAGRRALEDTIRRRHWNAIVEDDEAPNTYHLCWATSGNPLVTLIICSGSPKKLDRCLTAIEKRTAYPHREIIVVHHVTDKVDKMRRVLSQHAVKAIDYEGIPDFATTNNLGAAAATGEILVFLNDAIEPLAPSWLFTLVGQAMRPEIGIAGARLLYPSGAIQHAGAAIGIGDGCGHPGRGSYGTPYWNWTNLARNVSAVTGACLAIRTVLFRQLGGFDAAFPVNYTDYDLCLRVQKAGYRVVYDPAAALRLYERQTRTRQVSFTERESWYLRWSAELDRGDPFYSRYLSRRNEDASLGVGE